MNYFIPCKIWASINPPDKEDMENSVKFHKAYIQIICLLFLVVIAGCSTSISKDYALSGQNQKGILIVGLFKTGTATNKSAYISLADANGSFNQNLTLKKHEGGDYHLIELPAGGYQLCNVFFVNYKPTSRKCRLKSRFVFPEQLDFTIKAGEATYFGDVDIRMKTVQRGLRWSVASINRYFKKDPLNNIKSQYPNIQMTQIKIFSGETAEVFLKSQ